ncbi:MAG: Gfo/Idh/MocA family oxidoreductase [Acidobacteria bacterium]|nr:Gfo/Idh/MocA family oxidoreductase [Acidobacteriota bacterium]
MEITSNKSRRDFLKKSAIGAAGTAVLGGWGNPRVLGANDRIRVAILGSGGRARGVGNIFTQSPDCEIVAICDVYQPNLEEGMKLATKDGKSYLDYREVLDRKDIDAVLIGSPDHWHKQMMIDAVRAGKDAYLEKPIIHSIPEGAEMVRAVEETKRVVQTGTQQRSWDHYILGKQLVESGKLGKVIYVHTYWYQNLVRYRAAASQVDISKLDWKRWLGSAPDQPFDWLKFRFWRHYRDFAGGILTDLLTHWIDVIQWYLGEPAPKSVSTMAQRYILKEWDWPDAVTASMEFPGDFMVTFTGAYHASIGDGGIEFRGTQATLIIDREHMAVYSEGQKWIPNSTFPPTEIFVRSEHDGTIDHVKNFLECVRSRKTPTAPVQVGFEAARTGWLANIALDRGKRIEFDARNNKIS